MADQTDILALVKQSASKRLIFLPHAVRQMSKPDRMISTDDIRAVIESGEIIEDYPNDVRGQSFLILGFAANRPLHVVCSPKDDYLAIITAYLPSAQEWEENYRKRKKR